MGTSGDYTYPKFQYSTAHSTASFYVVADKKTAYDRVVAESAHVSVQTVLSNFRALSMTEPSTWHVRFHKHGFVIVTVAYLDDAFNWFTSVEQALDKHNRGQGVTVDEWRLIAESDRVLTKRDKCAIMQLYDGADEMRLAREMEDVE